MSHPLIEATDQIAQAWGLLGLTAAGDHSENVGGAYTGDVRSTPLSLDEALVKARAAKNGDAFAALFDRGDLRVYGGDHSAADMALVGILAFYLGNDPERIDEAFRRSKLYRSKWDRADYRDSTIGKVLRDRIAKGEPIYGDRKKGEQTASDRKDRKRRFLPLAEFLNRPSPGWLIHSVLPDEGYGCTYGAFGTYKSFIELDHGLSIATGRPWLDHKTTQGTVAYVAGEGGNAIQARVLAWCKHHGVDPPPEAFFILPESIGLIDSGEIDRVLDALRELPQPIRFVVLDTLARTYGAGSENDQQDMGRYVEAAGRIQAEFGAFVHVIHHENAEGGLRGSTVFPGALDVILHTIPTGGGVMITCEKQKNADEFKPIRLKRIKVWLDDGSETDDANAPIDFDRPSSLVFELADGAADDHAYMALDLVLRKALTALADAASEWLTQTEWHRLTDKISVGAFSKTANQAVADGLVELDDRGKGRAKYYRITALGKTALGRVENPFSTGGEQAGDPGQDAAGEAA